MTKTYFQFFLFFWNKPLGLIQLRRQRRVRRRFLLGVEKERERVKLLLSVNVLKQPILSVLRYTQRPSSTQIAISVTSR